MVVIASGPAAAPITVSAAATGGVFNVIAGEPGAGSQLSVSLPGTSRSNVQQFVVRVSGFISAGAGTYTATIQPLLYASTTAGFTAAASNAIFSASAVTWTLTQTAASVLPFMLEEHLVGDNSSGKIIGWSQGQLPTTSVGAALTSATTSPTIITNAPTSVNFVTEPPVQFAFGITIGGTAASTSVLNLSEFQIEQ